MADFDITVDTQPMANSLDHVNSNVRDVTTSVVAMQSAVVIAQQEASEHICKNVDKGFFVLLKSQFDQKIAAVSSEMLSKMQLMESFKNDIDKIMVIMQDDYERIKQRYVKHFSSLDKALETRIHELDKKAYEISRNYRMTQFKAGSEVIKAICYNDDTQLVNVKQASAAVKSKSVKSMYTMANDVIEQQKYSESIKNVLKEIAFEKPHDEYVPVIFSEVDSMIAEGSSIRDVFTSSEVQFSMSSRYLNQLKESSQGFSWKEVADEEFEPIKNSFQEKVSKEVDNERVAKEMLRLFDESRWSEMEGNE